MKVIEQRVGSYFFCCCGKTPNKNLLREDLFWLIVQRLQSIFVGKSWQQELGGVGHMASVVGMQRRTKVCVQLDFSLYSPSHGMVLPPLRRVLKVGAP